MDVPAALSATENVPHLRNCREVSSTNEQLSRHRKVVASGEPEDAKITGMTRSLDRRLLALNLVPTVGIGALKVRKVA